MIKTKDKGQTLQGVKEEEDNEEVGIKKKKKNLHKVHKVTEFQRDSAFIIIFN